MGYKGKVVVQFVVNKSGKIEDIEFLRSLYSGCDEEVIRLIESMPDWIPARKAGEKIDAYYTIPIQFKSDKPN